MHMTFSELQYSLKKIIASFEFSINNFMILNLGQNTLILHGYLKTKIVKIESVCDYADNFNKY